MTIPEAAQLILQAGALGKGGEVFILEMGTQVKITDMARDLIRLSGRSPDRDIEIVFTGLRPGEKLHEELITKGEDIIPTAHDKIMVVNSDFYGNGMSNQEVFRKWLLEGVEELYRLSMAHDGQGIKAKLQALVPEYRPQETGCIL
jgi:FlaA1/EpsC-like NDP-sugar epimerase